MKIDFLPAKSVDSEEWRASVIEGARLEGKSRKWALEQIERCLAQEQYLSACGTYHVSIDFLPGDTDGWPAMQWLSIKRADREPIRDWRILQAIKNGIVGEEVEAVELYPAESRLVDTANQYHLFALTSPAIRFPFGYRDRLVTETPMGKSKQRPFEKEATT
jgi:hypothetical protein